MSVKAMIGLLVALVIGGGLIAYGVRQLGSDEVTCSGRRMTRGDVCVTTSNGTTTRRNIDEQRSQDRQGYYIGIGVGSLIVVGGIFFTVLGARQRRRATAGH